MLEGLQRLVELQRLDDELHDHEEEHVALPLRREELAASRAECEAGTAEARASLEKAEVDQRGNDVVLQDQEALLQRLENQQFQVKSNDAYSALLSEMERARQAISDCETGILEGMDACEAARAALAAAEEKERTAVSRLEAEGGALDAREKELGAKLAELRERRDGVAAGLDSKLLDQYRRIARRRRPAVVLVSKELCIGCQVDIPPQSYIEILRCERIITCGNCTRILVHAPAP